MSRKQPQEPDPPALQPFLDGLTPIQARLVRASYETHHYDEAEGVSAATALRRWKKHITPFVQEYRAENAKRQARLAAKHEQDTQRRAS